MCFPCSTLCRWLISSAESPGLCFMGHSCSSPVKQDVFSLSHGIGSLEDQVGCGTSHVTSSKRHFLQLLVELNISSLGTRHLGGEKPYK